MKACFDNITHATHTAAEAYQCVQHPAFMLMVSDSGHPDSSLVTL